MLKIFNAPLEFAFAPRTHRTRVDIVGCGGKIKLGRVDEDVAAYWAGQDPAAFGTHIFVMGLNVQQKLDGTPINPRRSRKNWGCICNVAFNGGIEMEGCVEIKALAENGDQLLDYIQLPDQPSWPVNQVDDSSFFELDKRYSHVIARTFDVVCSSFIVESKQPFDSDLLDLNLVQTGWGTFITSISYGGQVIDVEDQVWVNAEAPKASVLKGEGK